MNNETQLIHLKAFKSKILQKEFRYYIYLPSDYKNHSGKFPVIYYLTHNYDNKASSMISGLMEGAASSKQSHPFIMVFVNIQEFGSALIQPDTIFTEEFIPMIENEYLTVRTAEGRCLEGFHSSGLDALILALKYPSVFSSVIAYGGALQSAEADRRLSQNNPDEISDETRLWYLKNDLYKLIDKNQDVLRGTLRIRLVVFDEDQVKKSNDDFHNCLDNFRLPHQYEILNSFSDDQENYYHAEGIEGFRWHTEAFIFSKAEDLSKPTVETHFLSNIEFGNVSGRSLLLDLYLPVNSPEPLPVIVWIHGGGWMLHSKEYYVPVHMIEKGYAIASINYRLSHQAIFPAQLEDCKASIRWLRAHAEIYNLNADRIGVWGNSAGGHLAALLGTTTNIPEFDAGPYLEYSSSVQAVCDYYGPIDMLRMNQPETGIDHLSPDSAESRLLGACVRDYPEKARLANPITYISQKVPPFLILHGNKDEVVHVSQGILLHKALKTTGADAVLHIVENACHGFELGDMDVTEINSMVEYFFNKHLKI